ncbi:hypothetical protein EDC94DRAFT_594146 [Helicostylum pulchrum]|nr:hypothetical protein EDC94DRAFT_594146 [Helicostylum pulchrum]
MNPRTRTTPLRRETSFEQTSRLAQTSPRALNSTDYGELSPLNYHGRSSNMDPSPYYERSEVRQFNITPQFNNDPAMPGSSESDQLLNSASIHVQPRKLFTTELMAAAYDKQQSREDRLRLLRNDALSNHLHATSSFIGEKLMVTKETVHDIYYLALSYYQQQQYERALGVLNKKQTLNTSVHCRYLAALCSIAMENGRDALDYLGHKNPFSGKDLIHFETMDGCIKLEAMMCYARGKAYLLVKEIGSARDCFKEALMIDLKCFDALECLVKFNMMEEKEEWEFVMTLPYEEQCGVDSDYFRYMYSLKLKKDILNADKMVSETENLDKSLDVQLSTAEKYFAGSQYEKCLEICKAIKVQDAFFKESITVHLSCLYELDMKTELYEYAQELVDRMNDEAVAWHAVGLYYLYIKNNLDARKYFSKALTINQFFQQSWLGYGHSFSAEKDHEQAINAYMACSRLIPGSYLPLMNIAMEYMEQNRTDLAFEYFTKSLQKSHQDPFLFNEIAVYYYREAMYKEAREHLHKALELAKMRQCRRSPIWEKIWCNLGHVYRHRPLQNYDRALRCFENALVRNPKNSDARATVGMIYQIQGKTARAIKEYHEALMNTEAGELINELLDIALQSNFNTDYAAGSQDPCLNDTFDIFLMADSLRETRDEVELELTEQYWNQTVSKESERISTALKDKRTPALNEELIIDEGDLRPNMSREWI